MLISLLGNLPITIKTLLVSEFFLKRKKWPIQSLSSVYLRDRATFETDAKLAIIIINSRKFLFTNNVKQILVIQEQESETSARRQAVRFRIKRLEIHHLPNKSPFKRYFPNRKRDHKSKPGIAFNFSQNWLQ